MSPLACRRHRGRPFGADSRPHCRGARRDRAGGGCRSGGRSPRSSVAQEARTRAVADYRELIGEIEAAIIATPTCTHHAIGMDLLAGGVPLFIEKPIAPTAAEATDLVDARAKKWAFALQVGHVERFNPALTAVSADVRDPKFIEATRTSGYTFRSTDIGVVLDVMIHDLDIVLSLATSTVDRCAGDRHFGSRRPRRPGNRPADVRQRLRGPTFRVARQLPATTDDDRF